MRVLRLLPWVLALTATPAAAQQPDVRRTASGGGCLFRLVSTGGTGSQFVVGSDTNYFANGGVKMMCVDSSARIASDSVAMYGRGKNTLVEFIGHVTYDDSLTTQTADRGTYYRNGDRWEARNNVITQNRKDSSTINGPSLDYFRVVPGVRDTLEMYAIGRPTIRSFPQDTGGVKPEPYVIVADRVRMRGNNRTWAGGQVTIDRSDFSARGDSLYLDNGVGNEGRLMGIPVMRGLGRDSFELHGRQIDLTLDHQAITYVKALGEGHAITKDLDLVADTIGLDLDKQKLVQTLAWGDTIKPHALAADYEIRGDSIAFDTPGQQLKEIRSFRAAWAGGKIDTLTHERDWMSGDTIVATFAQVDSAGTSRTVAEQLRGSGQAHSYYRVSDPKKNGGRESIDYARGDRIVVHMKTVGQRGVDRVRINGHADGLHLVPLPPPDSTASTSAPKGQR